MSKLGFLTPPKGKATKGAAASEADAPRRTGRPRGGKSGDPGYHALTVYVPLELHRAVKGRLVTEGGELSDLVGKLLAEWLKGGKAKRSRP